MEDTGSRHPVRLVVTDDLARSRLTVFFRLLLAIPHLLWLGLWSTVAFVIVVINWFATLFTGRSPRGLHDFLAGFLRYATHVEAYLLLAANPYPAFFVGSASVYPVDLDIDPPEPQSRWKTGFRLVLAFPAALLATVLLGGPLGWRYGSVGIVFTTAFLAWFSALARGRAPRGLRDLTAWCIGYGAQAGAYLFLLTDRYPYTGPEQHLAGLERPEVDERLPGLVNDDDQRRSRLTVLLRLPLAVPHIVWLTGWSLVGMLAAIANWFSVLAVGRSPRPLARFLAALVRYRAHVSAFLLLVGNPFPGFVGKAGSYPVDVVLDPFGRQSRWKTLFRLVLAWPAAMVALTLELGLLFTVAVLGWFVALVQGRMPTGLQRAGAYSIGYSAQLNAYGLLLTDAYPHASPQAVFVRREAAAQPLDSIEPGAFV